MAKNNNGKFKLISLMITLGVLLIGSVSGYVWTQADVRANTVQIEDIEEHGSEPTKVNKSSIGLIEYRLNTIDKKQEEFSTEQRIMSEKMDESFHEILKRLPEK
ncbi:hypothetical protein LCGC14_2358150 [marine sediment metagenome]|uniref:Uncharacterized protein n=1 Tax=marine sediment metagenome TaxID=412755 RepID=A0A0F9CUN3_9ZZZZ